MQRKRVQQNIQLTSSNIVAKSKEEQKLRDELLEESTNSSSFKLHGKAARRERQEKVNIKKTTQSLSSLVHRMNDEVKLSEQATMILTTSSSTLKDTSKEMHSIGASIRAGGKLITKYGRREMTDKILLGFALLMYFGVVLYILRRRVFTFSFGSDYWW